MKDKLIRMVELVEAGEDKDFCRICINRKECYEERVLNYKGDMEEIKFCSEWEEDNA